jgi:phenylacetate-CoA ligase
VSALKPGSNIHDIPFNRIEGFLGRSDNMVKLRGINVFPHAIGAIIGERGDVTGEYVCKVRRDAAGRDDMLVVMEHKGGGDAAEFAELLKRGLGIEVDVELVAPGATAPLTQIDVRQKPIRLIDERKS